MTESKLEASCLVIADVTQYSNRGRNAASYEDLEV